MGNQIPSTTSTSNLPFNYFQKGQDWTIDAEGLQQSPIDIVPQNACPSHNKMKMEFFLNDHTLTGLQVTDTGCSLQVNGSFSKLRANDVDGHVYDFEAVQFHFHAPAEHTINGKQYDLELHIVHQMTPESAKHAKTQRNLAVVAVFFELDDEHEADPNTFIEALKLNDIGMNINMNMNDLLGHEFKDKMTYYAYKGSLTTPSCSENANWYVVEKPLRITKSQMDHFNLRWKDNQDFAGGHGNNRPVQPLNGRTIMKSNNCCVKGTSMAPVRNVATSKENVKPIRTKIEGLDFQRDIVFEDLSMVGKHAIDHTQGFVENSSYKHKVMTPSRRAY